MTQTERHRDLAAADRRVSAELRDRILAARGDQVRWIEPTVRQEALPLYEQP